jgi:hypothetical protein
MSAAETITARLARYGVTHQEAGANGRLLFYRGRSMAYAHADQAEALLDLLDGMTRSLKDQAAGYERSECTQRSKT